MTESRAAGSDLPETQGGDPPCWMNRVCPECGRLAAEDPPTTCSACGAELPGVAAE